SALSCLAVLGVLAAVVTRARSRDERDHAFGLSLTAMLLVSPITWDHYFLLLMLPGVLLWRKLSSGLQRVALLLCLTFLWLDKSMYWMNLFHFHPYRWHHTYARPWQTLAALSVQTYALLGFFILGAVAARPQREEQPAPPADLSAGGGAQGGAAAAGSPGQ